MRLCAQSPSEIVCQPRLDFILGQLVEELPRTPNARKALMHLSVSLDDTQTHETALNFQNAA